MSGVVAGQQALIVDGQAYVLAEDAAKWDVGGWTAETIMGATKRAGSGYKARVAFIEVSVLLSEGVTSETLKTKRNDSTVVLDLLDRTVTLSFAELVGAKEVDASSNKVTLRFEGAAAKEVSK